MYPDRFHLVIPPVYMYTIWLPARNYYIDLYHITSSFFVIMIHFHKNLTSFDAERWSQYQHQTTKYNMIIVTGTEVSILHIYYYQACIWTATKGFWDPPLGCL